MKLNFPDLSEEDVDALLPPKGEVQLLKLKNRANAWTCGGPDPLFFDPEGRGDLLVPTVHALWRCPHMLDKLFTYSEVSPKVRMTPMHAPPLRCLNTCRARYARTGGADAWLVTN